MDGTAENKTVKGEASLPSCVHRVQSAAPATQEEHPDPQPGGSKDTRGHQAAAEFSGSVRRSLIPRQEVSILLCGTGSDHTKLNRDRH